MNTMVVVGGDCPIAHEVVGEDIHFPIGGEWFQGLTLVLTPSALTRFATEVNAALETVRAEPARL